MIDMLTDIIVILIVVAIIAAIVFYLVKQKKKGAACIGCPYCKECSGNCNNAHEFHQKNDIN